MSMLKKIKNFNLGDRIVDVYDKLEQAGITHWPVQATALGYYCILGLVPFLALAFTIAKSFGLEQALSQAINSFFAKFEGQDELLSKLKASADNAIAQFFNNYSDAILVLVAMGLIFWSSFRVLTVLEASLGSIFGYQPPRRVIHRLLDYFLVMIIVPMVLVAGGSVNLALATSDNSSWQLLEYLDPSGHFSSVFVMISPYLMWWFLMSWTFAYFSRGLVRWPERLLGGFICGVVFQVFQTFYLRIMYSLTSYETVYAGFAAIPLFMIWLYISWMIVFGGAELTRRLSDYFASGRNLLTLVRPATWTNTLELSRLVLSETIKNYQAEPAGGPTSIRQLSRSTGAPLPALGAVINRLLAVDLLVRISGPSGGDGPTFLPARSPELLTEQYITEALERGPIMVYN